MKTPKSSPKVPSSPKPPKREASTNASNTSPDASAATRQRASKKVRAKKWHEDNYRKHARGTEALRLLLHNLLEQAHIQVVGVTGRTKTLSSYVDKAVSMRDGKRRYKDPAKEILDVCGLRVVTFFDSTTKQVDALIRKEFDVDESNSMDKKKGLGTDRVGYRSVHYIARLKETRSKLAEYSDLIGMPFEIQVRSILQHAWAEIEHDRRFKAGRDRALPPELQRRFSLLAGGLEILDGAFDQLAFEVDEYNKAIVNAPPGPATTRLTLDVLTSYLSGLFDFEVKINMIIPTVSETGLKELRAFGVETLEALRDLIPPEFVKKYSFGTTDGTFTGVIQNAMIVKDATRYFESAWQRDWNEIAWETVSGLAKAGVPIEIFEKYGVVALGEDAFDDDLEAPVYDENGYLLEPDRQPPDEQPPDEEDINDLK